MVFHSAFPPISSAHHTDPENVPKRCIPSRLPTYQATPNRSGDQEWQTTGRSAADAAAYSRGLAQCHRAAARPAGVIRRFLINIDRSAGRRRRSTVPPDGNMNLLSTVISHASCHNSDGAVARTLHVPILYKYVLSDSLRACSPTGLFRVKFYAKKRACSSKRICAVDNKFDFVRV